MANSPRVIRTDIVLDDGSVLYRVPMKRLGPGLYEVGEYRVVWVIFDDGSTRWYWQRGSQNVDDQYATKWEAVNALAHALLEEGT